MIIYMQKNEIGMPPSNHIEKNQFIVDQTYI